MEAPQLRKLRTMNAKLMKENLSLLMSIREKDTEIQREWEKLEKQCLLLQSHHLPLPPSCQQLINN